MKNYGKVAVLMGGRSSERDISILTGNAVYNALIRQGVDAHLIDVGDDFSEKMLIGNFSRVFNALHGREGEDGVVQGFLEMLRIPYTGSNVQASALAMDKIKSKLIFQGLGLSTLPFAIINSSKDLETAKNKFGLPLCIKPAHEGSSRGVSKVEKIEELEKAYEMALEFDSKIMAEPWVTGREMTVAILNNSALPVIEIKAAKTFYDYHAKYFTNDTQYVCPAEITKEEEKRMQRLAIEAFQALDCKGYARIDFLQNEKGEQFIIEVNTIPGMTDHSLVPMAAKAVGIDFDALVLAILDLI